jgi:hypothetical protein
MNDDPRIEMLVQDLRKVKPYHGRWPWLGTVLVFGIIFCALFSSLVGWRHDLASALRDSVFMLELLLLSGLFGFGTVLVRRSSVPGPWPTQKRDLLIVTLGFVLLGGLFGSHSAAPAHTPLAGWPCLVLILANSALPMLLSVLMLRAGASTQARLSLGLAAVTSLGLAIGFQHVICYDSSASHLLMWHLAALPFVLGLACLSGHRVLRW